MLASKCGFHIESVTTDSKCWDFHTREAFAAFGSVTMVEWTKQIPEPLVPAFINHVLDRYRAAVAESSSDENTFKFYQMTILLARG